MAQRLIVGLLVLSAVVCAQRRVDQRNTYSRIVAVVPFVGNGTPADPKRPKYAPWPSPQGQAGIIAFFYEPTDDGRSAIVEFVARNRSAFQPLFNDRTIQVYEKGRTGKAAIEAAVKQLRKDFDLEKFGMVMP